MKPELIDGILDGYAQIIRDLLESKDRTRFERIARIAKLAHALHQQTAMRVADIDGGDGIFDVAIGDQLVVGGGVMRNIHQPQIDSTDVIREVVGAFHPVVGLLMEREQEQRVSKLFDLRDRLREAGDDTAVIDGRIARLIDNMKEKEDAANPSVVHPELLRRHPAGAAGPAELQGDRGEPDGSGNGRAPETPRDGDQEELADHDLGGRVELEGDDDGRCADRQGGGCACPRVEA